MVFESLSPRQKEILNLLCLGFSDFEIMEKLYIARNTLRVHISALYAKYEIEGYNRKVRLILARIKEIENRS